MISRGSNNQWMIYAVTNFIRETVREDMGIKSVGHKLNQTKT
jgi:hypothetical protein